LPQALSERFRKRAQEFRLAAETAATEGGRRVLLESAKRWEEIARQWEAWEALGGEPPKAS
jgi:hypothetical protein